MTNEEREFYRLVSELASDGLFVGHPGASDRLVETFEAAIEAQKRETPPAFPKEDERRESQTVK